MCLLDGYGIFRPLHRGYRHMLGIMDLALPSTLYTHTPGLSNIWGRVWSDCPKLSSSGGLRLLGGAGEAHTGGAGHVPGGQVGGQHQGGDETELNCSRVKLMESLLQSSLGLPSPWDSSSPSSSSSPSPSSLS